MPLGPARRERAAVVGRIRSRVRAVFGQTRAGRCSESTRQIKQVVNDRAFMHGSWFMPSTVTTGSPDPKNTNLYITYTSLLHRYTVKTGTSTNDLVLIFQQSPTVPITAQVDENCGVNLVQIQIAKAVHRKTDYWCPGPSQRPRHLFRCSFAFRKVEIPQRNRPDPLYN